MLSEPLTSWDTSESRTEKAKTGPRRPLHFKGTSLSLQVLTIKSVFLIGTDISVILTDVMQLILSLLIAFEDKGNEQ